MADSMEVDGQQPPPPVDAPKPAEPAASATPAAAAPEPQSSAPESAPVAAPVAAPVVAEAAPAPAPEAHQPPQPPPPPSSDATAAPAAATTADPMDSTPSAPSATVSQEGAPPPPTESSSAAPPPEGSGAAPAAPTSDGATNTAAAAAAAAQRPAPPAWYDQTEHINERRKMVTSIAKLLQARKPNAPTEWMKKLPQMARRLEESLFRGAPSFDEYRDQETLKKRLQKLALDMGIRAREQTQNGSGAPAPTSSNAGAGGDGSQGNGNDSQGGNSGQGGQAAGQPQTAQAAQASQQTQEQRQQVLRQQQQRLLLLRHASKCPHGEANEAVNADNHSEGARVKRGPGWKWGDQDGGAGSSGVLGKKKTNGWTLVTWEKTMEEREYRIGGEGAFDLEFGGCPVTQHCAGMRKLWKHIAECKDQQCQTPHCVSSRYVLSHYHRCRERGCAVCQPVREAIQRNHEKARELEAARQKQLSGRAQGGAGGGGQTGAKKSKKGEHGGAGAGKRPNGQANGQPKGGAQVAAGGAARLPAPPPMGFDANAELQRKQPQQKKSPDPNTSMIYTFTTAQIQAHIESLAKPTNLKPSAIRTRCSPVLKKLMDAEYGWIFKQPVDPVELNLPDYFDVVKKPMDLGTVKKKLDNSVYRDVDEFIGDVRLVFDNAMLYNGPHSDVTEVAKKMKKMFDTDWKRVQAEMSKEEEQRKNQGETCALCSNGVLLYEPTSYYCNGAACNGQRIRRNSFYYCDARNKYHWCHVCYGDLKDGEPLEMADCTLQKTDLVRKKNDEQHDEPWVGCDECPRWVHQICALFNGRKNQGETTVYHCPFCVLASRQKLKQDDSTAKIRGAKQIPHTRASAFIEKRVRDKLRVEQERLAVEKGCSVAEVPQTGKLYVRQLSNLKDKTHQVRPRIHERYKDEGFPESFPVTSKCLVLFEEIEGVDVILFGMYLYEYGHRAPQPNHRRIYVSYLDSVQYFRPRQYRTIVYMELLVSYLAYAKLRGFHTVHIWACPPLKGDDYIFFCHPEEQKTPKEDRLRNWYVTMLEKCREEGTVVHMTNLFDEHFKAPDSKASDVPYFEGDHWILEAEATLKAIEDEKEARRTGGKGALEASKQKKAKDKKAEKAKGNRTTRSDGDVEELNGRDPLVTRFCKVLEPMKEAFLVAYLYDRKFAEEKWQIRLKEIDEEAAEDARAAAGGGGASDLLSISDASEPPPAEGAAASSSSSTAAAATTKNEGSAAKAGPAPPAAPSSADAAAATPAPAATPGSAEAAPAAATTTAPAEPVTSSSTTATAGESAPPAAATSAPAAAAAATAVASSSASPPPPAPSSLAPSSEAAPATSEASSEPTSSAAPAEAAAAEMPKTAESSADAPVVAVAAVEAKPARTGEETAAAAGGATAMEEDTATAPKAVESSAAKEGEGPQSTSGDQAPAAAAAAAGTGDGAKGAGEESAGGESTDTKTATTGESDGNGTATAKAGGEKDDDDTKKKADAIAAETAAVKAADEEAEYPEFPPPADEKDDLDDQIESDFFDTRQQFLNLCQGNHYQFDLLRRAKHTSMMVLYHVHNPDIPKFLTSCSMCGLDINAGYRYDCPECPEFHLCHKCFVHCQMTRQNPHDHRLKKVLVQSENGGQLTEEQRRQRQRSIQLHMQLLAHAATCRNPACPSANCEKMKNLLQHGTKCPVKVQGGCNVCRRIWALLQIHARQCRRPNCLVPKCRQLKEQLRNIELQQAAMDERRRLAMNEQYARPAAAE